MLFRRDSPSGDDSRSASRRRGSERNVVWMVIGFAALLTKPSLTFPAFGMLYVLSGPLEWLWRRRTGRELELADAGRAEGGVS